MIRLSILINLTLLYFSFMSHGYAQQKVIELKNPSFEGIPHKGKTQGGSQGILYWQDCGVIQFPGESAPDIHPNNFWNVKKPAAHGMTYLGMVVRDKESWESVSQRLSTPLVSNNCYELSVDLSRSEYYISLSSITNRYENYTVPAVLRIWGGTGNCGRQQLLAESKPVANYQWQTYDFKLEPDRDIQYLTFEAYYKVPILIPYNGHILVDNISTITQINCDEPIYASIDETAEHTKAQNTVTNKNSISDAAEQSNARGAVAENSPKPNPKVSNQQQNNNTTPKDKEIVGTTSNTVSPTAKDNGKKVDFNGNKLSVGESLRMNNIHFEADAYQLKKSSYKALDEIYNFLQNHNSVVIEIGGHTSTPPTHEWADSLSTQRAQQVALYLINKGIDQARVSYKGYGKRFPIIKDDIYDFEARKINQRVELKVLSID